MLSQETQKFRVELLKKLSKEKDTFGDDHHAVVAVCAQVLEPSLIIIDGYYVIFAAMHNYQCGILGHINGFGRNRFLWSVGGMNFCDGSSFFFFSLLFNALG